MNSYFTVSGVYLGSDGVQGDKVFIVRFPSMEANRKSPVLTELILLSYQSSNLAKELKYQRDYVGVSTFDMFRGMVYAEMFGTEDFREPYGIANVIINVHKEQEAYYGRNCLIEEAIRAKSTALDDERFRKFQQMFQLEQRSIIEITIATGAVINAFMGWHDYSNGALYWQGTDFKQKTNGSKAHENFYKIGFKFTDQSHDLFGLGDIEGEKVGLPPTYKTGVPYVYQSTAAYAGKRNPSTGVALQGTTFMNYTSEYNSGIGRRF